MAFGKPTLTHNVPALILQYMFITPVDWSVQCKGLMIRSVLEKHSGRRIERSLRQLEYLSSVTTQTDAPVTERLRGVYSTCLPPIWQLQVRNMVMAWLAHLTLRNCSNVWMLYYADDILLSDLELMEAASDYCIKIFQYAIWPNTTQSLIAHCEVMKHQV